MKRRRPEPVRLVVYVAVALTGAVWFAQGIGVPIGGSFMVGDRTWAVIGAGFVAIAAGLLVRDLRRT
jgi:hypothetical protein